MSLARQELRKLEYFAKVGTVATVLLLTLWLVSIGMSLFSPVSRLFFGVALLAAILTVLVRGYIIFRV